VEIGELFAKRASLLDKIDRRRTTRDRGSPRGSCLVRVMSLLGQSRRFDRTTAASGLLRRTDILRIDGHVSKVPNAEVAAHSITSLAGADSDVRTISPRPLAVFKLMTSLNCVGCSTGRSAGFAPFCILVPFRFLLTRSERQACREEASLVTPAVDISLVVLGGEVDGH
jgi:hypothetical protein